MFKVKNDTFGEQLQTAIQNNETIQAILQEISLEDIKDFTQEDKFLIF